MIYFLAGLPRSGSTLLANLLAQNPLITATATSGVIDLLAALINTCEHNPTFCVRIKGRNIQFIKSSFKR
ncbi:sulfotransferase [Methylocucumis oryzae]|uniref:sulfotransferase n=1 Tax=Methylocucumis oryzae TaxID=1632867 RepID=UPI0034DFD630